MHRVVFFDRDSLLTNDGANIESFLHNMKSDSRGFGTFKERMKTWGHTPVLWEKRLVDIPGAESWDLSNVAANVLIKVGGNKDVRFLLPQEIETS